MRTVLITGANKGIGFATAKYFMEHGDRVVITGRSEKGCPKPPFAWAAEGA